jgi:hypothetical protein
MRTRPSHSNSVSDGTSIPSVHGRRCDQRPPQTGHCGLAGHSRDPLIQLLLMHVHLHVHEQHSSAPTWIPLRANHDVVQYRVELEVSRGLYRQANGLTSQPRF